MNNYIICYNNGDKIFTLKDNNGNIIVNNNIQFLLQTALYFAKESNSKFVSIVDNDTGEILIDIQ